MTSASYDRGKRVGDTEGGRGEMDIRTKKAKIVLSAAVLFGVLLFCVCGRHSDKFMKTAYEDRQSGQGEDTGGRAAEYMQDRKEPADRKETENAAEESGSLAGESESTEEEPGVIEQREKGYDLPVDETERKAAEEDCRNMMELIREMYVQADRGSSVNAVLSDEVLSAMQGRLGQTGVPVTTTGLYADMENFESADKFLRECAEGKSGSAVIYEIRSDGGIGRHKFLFDGTDLYVFTMSAVWNDKDEPGTASVSFARIEEWNYTDKGSFCYRVCVPEPPEVTEVVDGSCMLRIKPITQENRELSEKYVLGLGYQGNNLLCSDWDAAHMENLDYNGLYESLYAMKYHEKFEPGNVSGAVPKQDFESLMMEYLPVTEEELQKYAVYDEESLTYAWEGLDYSNHIRTYFGTSFPEITGRRENGDGTVTFTVDAVCRPFLCDDAVITHELTVRLCEDGSFRYLGNKILDDGADEIPEYQYRLSGR